MAARKRARAVEPVAPAEAVRVTVPGRRSRVCPAIIRPDCRNCIGGRYLHEIDGGHECVHCTDRLERSTPLPLVPERELVDWVPSGPSRDDAVTAILRYRFGHDWFTIEQARTETGLTDRALRAALARLVGADVLERQHGPHHPENRYRLAYRDVLDMPEAA